MGLIHKLKCVNIKTSTKQKKENEKMEKQTEQKTNEKIKVTDINIICRRINGDLYYLIKYKKVGEQEYTIGYGSYHLDNVMKWKEELFELVEEKQREQKKIDNTNKDVMKRMDNMDSIEMALSCVLTNQMSQMILNLENDKLNKEQTRILKQGILVTQQVVQDILKMCIPEEKLEESKKEDERKIEEFVKEILCF